MTKERDRSAIYGTCRVCQCVPCICGGVRAPDLPRVCPHGVEPSYKCHLPCVCGHDCLAHEADRGCMAGNCECLVFKWKE